MNKQDCMRTVRFSPYRKGYGPTFTLKLYSTNGERIGYTLTMREVYAKDSRFHLMGDLYKATVLFEGEDFKPSPMHSIDGNECVKALMGFLTLRPGDTDKEYFANYTETQLDYCSQHAESLSLEVMNRFGE